MKEFLEQLQLESLIEKYGDKYQQEIDKFKNQELFPEEFLNEYKEFYSLKEKIMLFFMKTIMCLLLHWILPI